MKKNLFMICIILLSTGFLSKHLEANTETGRIKIPENAFRESWIAKAYYDDEDEYSNMQGYEFAEAWDPLDGVPTGALFTTYLPQARLNATRKDVLAYMRNRIYAEHGYIFKSKEWRDEFSEEDWYRPNPNFSENLFNAYEKENIRRIKIAEARNR
jgi:hypothetical protein